MGTLELTPVTAISVPKPHRRRAVGSWDSVAHRATHNPWFEPVEPTKEVQELAEAIDVGGAALIQEVEG